MIEPDDERFIQEKLGKGEHRLTIKKVMEQNSWKNKITFSLQVKKTDEGLLSCKTPTNKGSELVECKCIFNVTEGESPPIIGRVEPVKCVAILHSYSDRMNSYIQKEACKIIVPYKIEGTRVSNLDVLVLKDKEEIEFGNEIVLNVNKDKIVIHIVNPTREHTGHYKVILTNDQGSCDVTIPVEVLDIPSPPQHISVKEIRKDSITLQWYD